MAALDVSIRRRVMAVRVVRRFTVHSEQSCNPLRSFDLGPFIPEWALGARVFLPLPFPTVANLTIANPWLGWGLKRDPYFQESLTPGPGAAHPSDRLFVGRKGDLEGLAGRILGSLSSRSVVEGAYGVGKTSYLSQLKYALSQHQVLSHADPIRVTRDMRLASFESEVLRSLVVIRSSLAPESAPIDTDEAMEFWRRTSRLVEGEDTVGGGASAAGFGLSRSPGRIPAERGELSLMREIARAIELLSITPAGPLHERRRVLLHINNFENLARADAASATAMLLDARDMLLLPHSHWVFVGAEALSDHVFAASPPLASVVPFTQTLGPLSPDEIVELLERRYADLRAEHRPLIRPVDEAAVRALYTRYEGDLRNFLALLSEAVHAAPVIPPASLTLDMVLDRAAPVLRRQLQRRVGGDMEALVRIAAGGSVVAQAELSTTLGIARSSVSDLVARLEAQHVLRFVEERNRGRLLRFQPNAMIALGISSE
jgi:hypothetical protein